MVQLEPHGWFQLGDCSPDVQKSTHQAASEGEGGPGILLRMVAGVQEVVILRMSKTCR